jgi:hypothetical protein
MNPDYFNPPATRRDDLTMDYGKFGPFVKSNLYVVDDRSGDPEEPPASTYDR